MAAKPTKKKTIKLQLELDERDEIIVRISKNWKKNASQLDSKVKARLAEGASYVATVKGQEIQLEASALEKAFDKCPEELVIVVRVKCNAPVSLSQLSMDGTNTRRIIVLYCILGRKEK